MKTYIISASDRDAKIFYSAGDIYFTGFRGESVWANWSQKMADAKTFASENEAIRVRGIVGGKILTLDQTTKA